MSRGYIIFLYFIFPVLSIVLWGSLETAPDRKNYIEYFSFPETATRIEYGFVLVIKFFDTLNIPSDVAIVMVLIIINLLLLNAAFNLISIPTTISVFPIVVFLMTVFVTATFIQLRYGLSMGIALVGYYTIQKRTFLGILYLLLSCTMHISMGFFVLLTVFSHTGLKLIKRRWQRIVVIAIILISPSAIFFIIFDVTLLNNYYSSYFSNEYANVVISLSSIVYVILVVYILLLKPNIDINLFVILGGIGILLLVISTKFAVFHRLYFPCLFIAFCHSINLLNTVVKKQQVAYLLFLGGLILLPVAGMFLLSRLSMF